MQALLNDFISFESDSTFGIDVHNAAADVALEYLPEVIDAARKNAMSPEHPHQAKWMLLYFAIVKFPIADGVDVGEMVNPEPTPKKAPRRRVTRKA